MQALIMQTAVFSDCRRFRYSLTREWDTSRGQICWIMLNPSTADDTQNDATIRRCIDFAIRWDAGGIVVVNLFAFISTFPIGLVRAKDPVGPHNDAAIMQAIAGRRVICAWGNLGNWWLSKFRDRASAVMQILGQTKTPAFCLGLTKFGHPQHPVRLPKRRRPRRFVLTKGNLT